MTSIIRTAYPRFGKQFAQEELCTFYRLTDAKLTFVKISSHGSNQRITFATLLKAYQNLGYFPALRDVPDYIRTYLSDQMGFDQTTEYLNAGKLRPSLHRYKETIRTYLQSSPYTRESRECVETFVQKVAYTGSLKNIPSALA